MSWIAVSPHTKDASRSLWKLQISANGKYRRAYVVIPANAAFRSNLEAGQRLHVVVDPERQEMRIIPSDSGEVQVVPYVGRLRFNVLHEIKKLGIDLPVGTYPLPDPVRCGDEGLCLSLRELPAMVAARQQAASVDTSDLNSVQFPDRHTHSGWKILVSPNGQHERAMLVIPKNAAHRSFFDGVERVVLGADLERELIAVRPAGPYDVQTVTLSLHGTSLKLTIPSVLRKLGLASQFPHGTHEIVDPIRVGDTLIVSLTPAAV